MEVGTEISQKIRSAIKAKLIELGAYVDDELPDYIMVMVANKKSREQMISDLSLFLGKNTDVFAEWLHGLLSKLQTLSVDSNAAKSVKEKKKSVSKKDKKSKKSGKTEGSSQVKKVKSNKGETSETANDKSTELKSKGLTDDEQKDAQGVQNEGKEPLLEAEVEDVRQMLVTVAPTDELAAELETTEVRIEQSQQIASQIRKSGNSESEKVKSAVRTTERKGKRSASPNENERRVQSSSAPKKYKGKGLTSVVASVSKDMEDEEEEEYDPLCPAVGNVASVVKVTNRRSKVPPALQANNGVTGQSASEMEVTETNVENSGSVCDSHQADSDMVRIDQTASLDRIRAALMEVLEQSKEDSNKDDIAAFCENISCCLRKMNQRNLAIAKLRIQKILFDYESSIQSGGNNRWTAATTSSSSYDSVCVNSSSVQISSSSSGNRNTAPASSGQRNPSIVRNHSNNSNDIATADNDDSTKQTVKVSSVCSLHSLDSPSLSSLSNAIQKQDNSLVSSSSRTDHPGSSHHQRHPHQSALSSKSSNSPQTSESNSSMSQSTSHLQPSTSFHKTIDCGQSSALPPISLDSLHLKRRSELESTSSPSKSSSSVLKFGPVLPNAPAGGSGDSGGQVSGTDSPKPISAEQLKVLAKNLKITITNSHAKSSDDDESSSEGSDESDSEEDDDEQEDDTNTRVDATGASVAEDSREVDSEGTEQSKLSSAVGKVNDIALSATFVEGSESCKKNGSVKSSRQLKD